jgi:hypothetical protein
VAIEIVHIYPDNTETIINELIKLICPDFYIDNNISQNRRIFQKLVREKSIVLQYINILLKVECPIFILIDLLHYVKRMDFSNIQIQWDNLSMELPDNSTDSDKLLFNKLGKKIIITKSELNDQIKEYDINTLLPLASYISFLWSMNCLDIFHIVSTIRHSEVHPKTLNFVNNMFDYMTEQKPLIFSNKNMEIYLSNKER